MVVVCRRLCAWVSPSAVVAAVVVVGGAAAVVFVVVVVAVVVVVVAIGFVSLTPGGAVACSLPCFDGILHRRCAVVGCVHVRRKQQLSPVGGLHRYRGCVGAFVLHALASSSFHPGVRVQCTRHHWCLPGVEVS